MKKMVICKPEERPRADPSLMALRSSQSSWNLDLELPAFSTQRK
jgi:hypothetical protein